MKIALVTVGVFCLACALLLGAIGAIAHVTYDWVAACSIAVERSRSCDMASLLARCWWMLTAIALFAFIPIARMIAVRLTRGPQRSR